MESGKTLTVEACSLRKSEEEIKEQLEKVLNEMWDSRRGIERTIVGQDMLVIIMGPKANPNPNLVQEGIPGLFVRR